MKKEKNLLPVIIILAVLVAGGIFGGVVLFSHKSADAAFEKEFKQIDDVNIELEEIRTSKDYLEMSVDKKAGIMLDALEEQAKAGNIIEDSIELDEENYLISYYYSNGMLGIENFGALEGYTFGNTEPTPDFSFDKDLPTGNAGDEAEMLILNALSKKEDDGYEMCLELAKDLNEYGIGVILDNKVTIDDLTNLKGYKFVFFEMHGTFVSRKNLEASYIATNEKYSEATNKQYQKLINGHQIATSNGCYCVSSQFFEDRYKKKDFSGSIFYFGSCQLMGKGSKKTEVWTEVLDELSVSAFVGFHNSVNQYYGVNFGRKFLGCLIGGCTAKDAYDQAVKKMGKHDTIYRSFLEIFELATPAFRGKEDAKISFGIDDVKSKPSVETQTDNSTPSLTPVSQGEVRLDAENFPDEEFRKYVANYFDLDFNCILSEDELQSAKEMYIWDDVEGGITGYSISDYKGIEFFTELTMLSAPYNYSEDIVLDISRNPKLETVELFSSYDPVSLTMRIGQTVYFDYIGPNCSSSDPIVVSSNLYNEVQTGRLNKITANSCGEATLTYMNNPYRQYGDDYDIDSWSCKVKVIEEYVDGVSKESEPLVIVTDALKQEFMNYDDYMTRRIPGVFINGKNTDAVNSKIMADADEYPAGYDAVTTEVCYSYRVVNNYVSVCMYVNTDLNTAYGRHFYVYCISIDTGALVEPSEMIHDYGMSDDALFELVYTQYRALYEKWLERGASDYYQSLYEDNLNRINYDEVRPFFSPDGDLCFIGHIEVPGDPEDGDFIFNTESTEMYTFFNDFFA